MTRSLPPVALAVDGRALRQPVTGVGRYAAGLLPYLPVDLALTKDDGPLGVTVAVRRLGRALPDPAWNELYLRPALRRVGAYWAINSQLPWGATGGCWTVATVHDLLHREPRVAMPGRLRRSRENAVRASVRRADVLTVPSGFVSEQLRLRFGRAADLVIPPGPTVGSADPEALAAVTARQDACAPDHRWALYVGSELPRKNLVRLAEAVSRVDRLALAVVGPRADPAVGRELDRLGAAVPLLRAGYVSQAELAAWYASAALLAYPSLGEGTGLPLLDARRLGLAIVTSDRPPLTEHAGPAAVLVDPTDVDAIGAGLRRALTEAPPAPEQLPGWAEGGRALRAALEPGYPASTRS